jgi:hypothetical protein
MKRIAFLFLLAALLVPLLTAQAFPVDLKKGKPAEPSVSPSDLTVSVNLLGEKGGVYRAGREIRFSFSATRDAYVVVYNIDSDGYVHLLWPEDGRLVLTEGGKTVSVPEPGRDVHWETGDKTGIEYIHALAVPSRVRVKDEELYFLAQSDEMPPEKRFRIDIDPYLAFNMIDEQIIEGAESIPPATDYTYFYINRQVDYPRYLCSKCHAPEKLPDPYAMQCTEIVIEESTYEQEPHYPYPPLYDIRHVGEQAAKGDSVSGRSGEEWLDEDNNEESDYDNHTHLSFYFGNYDWPYYGGYLFSYYPFYWDPFWWDYGWWGFYYPRWHHPWWYTYDYWWGNDWRWCGDYDWGRCNHRYRPILAERTVTKRYLDYGNANTLTKRERALTDSRLVKEKRGALGSRLERGAVDRGSLDRNLGRAHLDRSGGSTARGGTVERRIVYPGARGGSGVDRSRGIDRSRGDVNVRTPRSGSRSDGARTPRTRESTGRERYRDTNRDAVKRESPPERRATPERRYAPEQRNSSRERSGDSSAGKQRSSDSNQGDRNADRKRISQPSADRSYSRSASNSAPRYHEASSRSVSRTSSAASAPARTVSSPPPASRTRTR